MFNEAEKELKFLILNINALNSRDFSLPTPNLIGWSDASSRAVGGVIMKLNDYNSRRIFCLDESVQMVQNSSADWHADFVHRAMDYVKGTFGNENCSDYRFVHRMLTYRERNSDSNERELKAVTELLFGAKDMLRNNVLVLHVDNNNVEKVLKNGSGKIRLQNYALQIEKFCHENCLELMIVTIPRSINTFADAI